MDSPENRSKIPADFQNTVRVLARRATFVAGFAYYQIGRFQYAGPVGNSGYVFFNTVAFLLAVVTAGTGTRSSISTSVSHSSMYNYAAI